MYLEKMNEMLTVHCFVHQGVIHVILKTTKHVIDCFYDHNLKPISLMYTVKQKFTNEEGFRRKVERLLHMGFHSNVNLYRIPEVILWLKN